MSTQTISRPSPPTDELTIETLDAQHDDRDVAGQGRATRSLSTGQPQRTHTRIAPLPQSFAGRPRGHVIGHGPGEPPPPSFAGRPHGHIVGHGPGEPPPPSFAGRPQGHVVGRGVGAPSPMPTRT